MRDGFVPTPETIWRNKVVLITGASSGLGAEMARQLAAGGAKVALVARRADTLDALVAEITKAGGTAQAWPADVADAAAVSTVASAVESELGPIDVAVANAGIGDLMRSHQFDAALVSRVMRINVEGAANTFGAVLPSMVTRRQGQIVGVSSLAAWRGLPTSGPRGAARCDAAGAQALRYFCDDDLSRLRAYADDRQKRPSHAADAGSRRCRADHAARHGPASRRSHVPVRVDPGDAACPLVAALAVGSDRARNQVAGSVGALRQHCIGNFYKPRDIRSVNIVNESVTFAAIT